MVAEEGKSLKPDSLRWNPLLLLSFLPLLQPLPLPLQVPWLSHPASARDKGLGTARDCYSHLSSGRGPGVPWGCGTGVGAQQQRRMEVAHHGPILTGYKPETQVDSWVCSALKPHVFCICKASCEKKKKKRNVWKLTKKFYVLEEDHAVSPKQN